MSEDVKRLEILMNLCSTGESNNYSDFTIIVENSTFPVHKAILGFRSPYFNALFSSNMSESANGRLTLDDIEVDVFDKLLKYIYTYKLDLDDYYAVKLIIHGEKYGLGALVDLCEDHLLSNMNPEIASQCFVVGSFLGRKMLKANGYSMMAADWEETFSTDGWHEVVKNHSLMTEIEMIECTEQLGPLPEICSQIYRIVCEMKWRIKVQPSCSVESPTFSLLEDDQSLWRLSVRCVVCTCENSKTCPGHPCKVYLTHIGPPLVNRVTCDFSILCTNPDILDLPKGTIDTSCCFSENFRCTTLLSAFLVDHRQPDLVVKLKIYPESSPTCFSDYLDKTRFTDAVVHVDGVTFPCHKIILSKASPFFAEAFQDQSELQLNELKPLTFKNLLLIIYHSQQTPDEAHFDLLTAAKRFQLDENMLNRCRSLVFQNMKDKGLMDFLIQSHSQKDQIQKKMAFKQIAYMFEAFHLDNLPDWHRMGEHVGLHEEFFKYLIEKRNFSPFF